MTLFPELTSRLPNVGTTIFTVMSKLAADYKAINLSQGFPNFPVDERLIDIVARLAKEDIQQYLPMAGGQRFFVGRYFLLP